MGQAWSSRAWSSYDAVSATYDRLSAPRTFAPVAQDLIHQLDLRAGARVLVHVDKSIKAVMLYLGMLRAELSEDDLHPNAKGYAVMAPLAEAAIQRALSR